jgi:hypothetical protein
MSNLHIIKGYSTFTSQSVNSIKSKEIVNNYSTTKDMNYSTSMNEETILDRSLLSLKQPTSWEER